MTVRVEDRIACASDFQDIRALLQDAGLPFDDLSADAMPDFMVLRDARGELLAAGGIERCGSDGLLRSVVVAKAGRGEGLGRHVVALLENHARAKGINTLYLLTTTAADFFPRLGYMPFDRAAVPAAVAASTEFALLCPASAVCLEKKLEQGQ